MEEERAALEEKAAEEAAKKAADFIAEPAAQDGVEKAFVKLGMIEL